MKGKQKKQMDLVEGGKHEWETTREYRTKVEKIRQEVTEKYSTKVMNENNWIKGFLIKIRRELEIRKRVDGLSSYKNLHIWTS